MISRTFRLEPFEPLAPDMHLSITGRVIREGTDLSLDYWLSGDLEKVEVAPIGSGGARRDRLWEQTCFEFFLVSEPKPTADTPYWEFNLSPSKDWNVYALDRYRRGLREESTISHLPFDIEKEQNEIHLNLQKIDISSLVSVNQPLWLGVSAVISIKAKEQTFWAIVHPALEADFHHPDSFVLSV